MMRKVLSLVLSVLVFILIPLVQILYNIEYRPVIDIPEGSYGLLVAKDGLPLRSNQFIADTWGDENFDKMVDATHFLTEGKGQKGPQLDVLRPGKYRINQYLYEVKLGKALDVPTGHVAVIRSNVKTAENCTNTSMIMGKTGESVATPIVPKGCIGVWDEPLPPAYVSTIIPTRLQTWTYKGGYNKRIIDLTVDDNGTIKQKESTVVIPVPKNAADRAINVRVEGWTIPVEMRVIVQVHPKNASQVVASVGNLKQVEDNIITPAIRDILRTIGGSGDRRALDFIEKRDEIVSLVENAIGKEGLKAGVSIQEVRMGEPAIPPELLVATYKETYAKEKIAQQQRIAVERERSTANQQEELVRAEIAKQAAEFEKEKLRLEGEGQKLKLIEIALGQKEQAKVLGEERVMQLQALDKILQAAVQNPDIVKVPSVQVSSQSGSGSLEGAAAVLGSSNLINTMKNLSAPTSQKMPAAANQ
ncbi:hypothetical protein GQR58_023133 [Nymphon striatum]|nr:hypothetical protein GQR58_023133 [Nymphon striatum]